jgi:hypothetical protein
MYFPDLSNYSIGVPEPLADVLNVGWLVPSVPFTVGQASQSFMKMLRQWFKIGRVNQMRGIYQCNFCPTRDWPLPSLTDNPSIDVDGTNLYLGNWEIWIPGPNGTVFASPGLISHYVGIHGYCPPVEFINAVMDEKSIVNWDAVTEFKKRVPQRSPKD